MSLYIIRALTRPSLPAPIINIFCNKLHLSAPVQAWTNDEENNEPKKFLSYNKKIYPPQEPNEPPRPAFVCHQRCNIKYSPWKMWYIASFVRGMTVDEALRQLKFVTKKGAAYARQTIEEARELAVKEHNVEFASNLWVAESFTTKGTVIKGIRRHARGRPGLVEYFHCHYFVRLEEGKPPKDYYPDRVWDSQQLLGDWLKQMRKRKITNSI